MSDVIEKAFPNKYEITGNEMKPRSGAFEVTYTKDGKDCAVLFSKLHLNRFPTAEEIVQAIDKYDTSGEILEFEPGTSWCTLL